jgi:hypothetical protein
MARDGQKGAIIPCSKGELEASKSMHIIGLSKESGPLQLIPLDPKTMYVFGDQSAEFIEPPIAITKEAADALGVEEAEATDETIVRVKL